MNFNALLDVSLFQDVIFKRKGWEGSLKVLTLFKRDGYKGWISSLTRPLIYILCAKKLGEEKAREVVAELTSGFPEVPLRRVINEKALKNQLHELMDSLQIESALQFHLDGIITTKKLHSNHKEIPLYSPQEFIDLANKNRFSKTRTVPFLDLKAQHHQVYNQIDDQITDIIRNTEFIMGKGVEEFEEGFAALHGAKYCIGTSSGTDSLHLALWALGIGPGDQVVVPVNTFIATAEAVSLCGAEPVFVDCDNFYNLDVKELRKVIESRQYAVNSKQQKGPITNNGSRITCIIPVHLYGQPSDMPEIMAIAQEYGLKIVEDACQAHLAKYQMPDGKWQPVGTVGNAGAFSFFPGKNLGAYGEAGAVTTNSDELYERMRLIYNHGSPVRYHHDVVGHNYRMEAIQGAVLNVKLKYIEEWTKQRQEKAALYSNLLGDIDEVIAPEIKQGRTHSFHLYVVQCKDRDNLRSHLEEQGISTGIHYPIPLHLQKAYGYLGYKRGDFLVAEKLSGEILSLPMYPELTETQIHYVVNHIKGFYAKGNI